MILEENILHLIFDYMDSNVQKLINIKSTDLNVEWRIKLIIYDALKGLDALHQNGFAHWNLKPSHLFIKESSGKVLIGDLSWCVDKYARVKDQYVGTKFYQAPEIILGSTSYNEKCDIFSLGLVFCHLLLRRPLISGIDHAAQLNEMCALFGTPTEENWSEAFDLALDKEYRFPLKNQKANGIIVDPVNLSKVLTETSEEAIDLIYKMWMMNPEYRISAEDCLKHPYFENLVINDDKDEVLTSYFMNKEYYHPDHDPREYYRSKIKDKYKKDFGRAYKQFMVEESKTPEKPFKHNFPKYHNRFSLLNVEFEKPK